jgi:hypothetical protein
MRKQFYFLYESLTRRAAAFDTETEYGTAAARENVFCEFVVRVFG